MTLSGRSTRADYLVALQVCRWLRVSERSCSSWVRASGCAARYFFASSARCPAGVLPRSWTSAWTAGYLSSSAAPAPATSAQAPRRSWRNVLSWAATSGCWARYCWRAAARWSWGSARIVLISWATSGWAARYCCTSWRTDCRGQLVLLGLLVLLAEPDGLGSADAVEMTTTGTATATAAMPTPASSERTCTGPPRVADVSVTTVRPGREAVL